MKQTIVLCGLMLGGFVGCLYQPIYGVLLYYLLAVWAPQYLWDWALPPDVRWSFYAAVMTLMALVIHMSRVIQRASWNHLMTMVIFFAMLVVISALSALRPEVAAGWTINYIKVFIMLAVATVLIDQMRYMIWLAVIIFLSISHIAWDQNWIYVVQDFIKIYRYGYGSLDNNGAGLLIAMGIPFAYAFAMVLRHWALKLACVCSGLIMMHVVLLTFSRGAMLSSLVALGWIGLIHRPRWQMPIGVGGLLILISIMAGPEVRQRFFSISEYQKDESASVRLESWAAAWEMAWDHPLTGVGVRNANFYGENYGTDFWGRSIHSLYLQVAADSGIPAMVVYIFIALGALWCTQRTRMMLKSVHDDPPDDEDESSTQKLELTERQRRQHRLVYYIAVALQGSLITFFFGAIFLSVEALELAWLEIAMAGALPGLTQRMLAGEPDAQPALARPQSVAMPAGRRRLTELAEAGP